MKNKKEPIFDNFKIELGPEIDRSSWNITLNSDSDLGVLPFKERIQQQIKHHKDSLEKAEECLKQLEAAKYKEGDVLLHKTKGKVFVIEVYIDEYIKPGILYKVSCPGFDRFLTYQEEELLPLNELTQGLYDSN